MLVIIEGPDFAGKSPICSCIADQLEQQGITVIRSRACLSKGVVEHLVSWVQDQPHFPRWWRSLVFHFAYFWDYCFWKPVAFHKVLLQESYSHRVWAYDIVHKRVLGKQFLESIDSIRPRADLAYYLDCPLEIRKERYLHSSSTDPRDRERFTRRYAETLKMDKALLKKVMAENYQFVSTNEYSVKESAHFISCAILEYVERTNGK